MLLNTVMMSGEVYFNMFKFFRDLVTIGLLGIFFLASAAFPVIIFGCAVKFLLGL